MTPKQTATRRSLRIALRDNRFRNDDFISTSPYEILCTIVRHVPLIDLDECLLVCRRWRALLLECPVPWQTFKMEPMCFIGNASYMDSPALSLLPSVCKHIEVLDFQDFHDTYVKTMSVFLTHDFPKLRSLHINDQVDVKCLYEALKAMSRKPMELSINAKRMDVFLEHILHLCPAIEKLTVHARSSPDWNHRGMTLPGTTNLTFLHLSVREQWTTTLGLEPLFRQSPHLRTLIMNNCEDDIMLSVRDHCPKLQVLIVNYDGPEGISDVFDEEDVNNYPQNEKNVNGLRHVLLGCITYAVPFQGRLDQSRLTLESLLISALGPEDEESWSALWSSVMPNVKKLQISSFSPSLCTHVPAILRAFPNLTTFKQSDFDHSSDSDRQHQELPMEVTQLSKLSHLHLRGVEVRNKPAFNCLLDKHISLGMQSTLRMLEINGCAFTTTLLMSVAQIQTLEGLHLVVMKETLPHTAVQSFQAVAQLSRLSYLRLDEMKISKESAQAIATCKSLKKVSFAMFRTKIDHDSVEYLRKHIAEVVYDQYR